MKKMSRDQYILLIFLIFVFIIAGILLWQNTNNKQLVSSLALSSPINEINQEKESSNNKKVANLREVGASSNSIGNEGVIEVEESKIFIHVVGEVINSGVYELTEGSRIIDAVQAAGGATSLANLDNVNLAAPIYDGQQIYIPSVIDKLNQLSSGSSTGSISSSHSNNSSNKININTASSSELQNLSGIGPSKADYIIDYRNDKGPFKKVEELLEVSGIGESTLEKIRDDVVVR